MRLSYNREQNEVSSYQNLKLLTMENSINLVIIKILSYQQKILLLYITDNLYSIKMYIILKKAIWIKLFNQKVLKIACFPSL